MNPFEFDSSRPIRRDVHVKLTTDANGNPSVHTEKGEAATLSKEGSVDRQIFSAHLAYSGCGCNMERPMGGQCYECRRFACIDCFIHCQRCRKGLCGEHRLLISSETDTLNLCPQCHGVVSRQRFWRAVLSPFVTFTDSKK